MPEVNPLWSYSCAVYAWEEVAAICLELQDEFGFDVNLLLYGGWLASRDQLLDAGHMERAAELVASWRQRVVEPLRHLRRQLRDYPPAAAQREQLKALELQAEQHQQALLFEHYQSAPPLVSAGAPFSGNLRLVAGQAAPEAANWDPVLERLSAQLSCFRG